MKWTAGAGLLLAFGACGPRPTPAPPPEFIITYTASPPVFESDRAWFSIVRSQGGHNSRVFLVECPRTELAPSEVICTWHLVPEQQLGAATSLAIVRARAASDHACVGDSIRIQSGDEATGYWLDVCGRQRFYRNEGGTWTDRTP